MSLDRIPLKNIPTPYYVFDKEAFVTNVKNLNEAVKKYYPNFKIAYSYKTNYANYICKLANTLGCCAEVVSPMELDHAVNLSASDIVYNGVVREDFYKCYAALNGVKVNVDNVQELAGISVMANDYGDTDIHLGVRLNFDIGNDVVSRFGIDVKSPDFQEMIAIFKNSRQLKLVGVHCHISKARELPFWEKRVDKMIECIRLLEKEGVLDLQYIDLGSNMYGPMEESLAKQFGDDLPTYEDYAKVIGERLSEEFKDNKPLLILEAGTPIVANTIGVVSSVVGIKTVRGKTFVTMDCSKFNLGAIVGVKNVPITVYVNDEGEDLQEATLVGYTCIEYDVLNTGYNGKLSVGSKILFKNVGAYSNTFAPQFIMPTIAMVTENGKVIKEADDFKAPFVSYR